MGVKICSPEAARRGESPAIKPRSSLRSRQLGSATSRADTRCRPSQAAHKRPRPGSPARSAGVATGAAPRKVASHWARRCLAAVGVVIGLAGVALPQTGPPPPANPHTRYTFKVNVGMVVLHATVRTRAGAPVSGLAARDFQIDEDGALQQIRYFGQDDVPVTAGLVIDNSGSMGPKRSEVIAAAVAFAQLSNPQDQLFVVNFNEHVWFGLPPGMLFTSQAASLESALSRTIADGETALYDAVAVALAHLKQGDRDKKVLIVISDGGDDASRLTRAQTLALAKHSDAIIYALGIYDQDDPDQNADVLKDLAEASGGEAFFPHSVEDALPICEQIARDIRTQYTIAYVPTNRKRDGTYRTIRVKAAAPGRGRLSVQTRAGYFAPPPASKGSLSSQP